jgi:hypothetical protein
MMVDFMFVAISIFQFFLFRIARNPSACSSFRVLICFLRSVSIFFATVVTMKFLLLPSLVLLSTFSSCSEAFVPVALRPREARQNHVQPMYAKADKSKESDENVGTVATSPFEAGSQEELMYALGVNLARQLGDIRPLVESGDELANVAKGLLDTVVGRLTDDGQRSLLASRGKDLNELITSRA